ncbi:hypothetical protein LTR66_007990 [Elasticomyces elasticus]|nr:hypothetical protein LTR66_007990 [Elasticomyces elasticus]KAK4993644.1 hypothetical protein LTR50_000255 [Elasticomyces elasticus]
MSSGFSPEIFSRIGGEIYVAGLNSSTIPLPEVATDAKIGSEEIEELKKNLSDVTDSCECFRPVTPRGQPILCRIPDTKLGDISTRGGGEGGIFVAAGHGPWGGS